MSLVPPPKSATTGPRTSRTTVAVALVLVIGGAFALGMVRRHAASSANAAQTHPSRTGPRVELVTPKVVESKQSIELPGMIKALEEAQIYPRASGYVRNWFVDIGDKVAAGQLLAEIDAPELDAQLAQAKAQLVQAQAAWSLAAAQRKFSKTNAERYGNLAGQELVSKSTAEQTATQAATDAANVASARANVLAQQANVERLHQTKLFTKITAPFAGRIARRDIDRGMLVTEGNSTEMFDVVVTDPVRVFIDVPQTIAPSVQLGTEAKLTVREFGARVFTGRVTRASSALDADSHTLSTEVLVPNPDGVLLPGMYVQVSLALAVSHQLLEIPATALYSDAAGLRVAKVDKQQKVHFVPVTVDRDTGATLQLSSGPTASDKILKIAIPTLGEGDAVDVAGP